MIVDYWIIRRGNMHVPSLFTKDKDAPYTYYKGWNPRAIVAWVSGVAFTIHGLAGAFDANSVNDASKSMYKLGFLLSLLMGGLVYWIACLIFPIPVYSAAAEAEFSPSKRFESMAKSEGFFEGEGVDTIRGALAGPGNGIVFGDEKSAALSV